MVMESLAEPDGIAELAAVQGAARVDHRALFRGAKFAGAVEILQCQTDGIGDLMAAGADRIFPMSCEAVARGPERRLGILKAREVDIGRRIGHFLAQQCFTQSPATLSGRAPARM